MNGLRRRVEQVCGNRAVAANPDWGLHKVRVRKESPGSRQRSDIIISGGRSSYVWRNPAA